MRECVNRAAQVFFLENRRTRRFEAVEAYLFERVCPRWQICFQGQYKR